MNDENDRIISNPGDRTKQMIRKRNHRSTYNILGDTI